VPREVPARGEAEVLAMPDFLVVRVQVEANGVSQQEAYAAAAAITSGVDEVLVARLDEISRARTTSLVVAPRTRWRSEAKTSA
jgi:hypothetical protein